jgi:hypothetical protein
LAYFSLSFLVKILAKCVDYFTLPDVQHKVIHYATCVHDKNTFNTSNCTPLSETFITFIDRKINLTLQESQPQFSGNSESMKTCVSFSIG